MRTQPTCMEDTPNRCATAEMLVNAESTQVARPMPPLLRAAAIDVQARLTAKAALATELEWQRGRALREETVEALYG